ncbi:kinase-like protein [Whalleya microplaca]|nr:kinase-like protein [Whalleya microplaca]
MNNISVNFGPGGPTPPQGRRRRRNLDLPIEGVEQVAVREVRAIKRYFSEVPSYYKFERAIANGKHGVAVLIKQKARENPHRDERLFVVKRAYEGRSEERLRHEISVMQRLRGAPHIAQPVVIDPDPLYLLSRPALILEYAENGTLDNLIDNVQFDDRPLPNRVLWGFFTCLLRMCIAMAWPDRGVEGAPYENEKFPNDWQNVPQIQLIHGDMHQDNILIGDLWPPADEHTLTPILKLIDFSEARVDPDPDLSDKSIRDKYELSMANSRLGTGVKTNIFDIARIMRMLITCDKRWEMEPGKVVVPYNLATKEIWSASACIAKPEYPNLDDDLRNIVMRCSAMEVEDRPTLAQLSDMIERNITVKNYEYYRGFPRGRAERERRIQRMLHDLVFYPWDDDN